jgi:hypothetical protein
VARRVQVAASAFFVASGLFMCGLGGALAVAEPGHRGSDGDSDRHSQHDGDRRGDGDDSSKKPGERETNSRERETRESETRESETRESSSPEITPPPKETPTITEPTKTTTRTTTKPTSSPTVTPPPGQPPGDDNGGGDGGGVFEPPRARLQPPPDMQLPPPREIEPVGPDPGVVDAGAGAPAVAGLPVGPITMPVIVSPLGGPGGGTPGAPSGPGLQGGPRGITEPPLGRERLPANLGGDGTSSYRIGYPEYLRTAGLPQVAALAVPGIGGILVLTGAGGLVGYRQAKAGHALRSGTARFMN